VLCTSDGRADGADAQLATAAGFRFSGMVGSSRASWVGTWFFVRKHPVYDGLPVDRAMSIEYQIKGSDSNGLIVDGDGVEIIAAYSRDHDRKIGAGTFAYAGQGRKSPPALQWHSVPNLAAADWLGPLFPWSLVPCRFHETMILCPL
jgi:hypothetical protein